MEGLTQFVEVPGVIDLGWGHPGPELLPIPELRAATERAIERYGTDMFAYGHAAGPLPLRQFIADRLKVTDARAPGLEEIVITGGVSQGLDLAATLLIRPGDTVLVSEPTYHLALRILAEDHRFHVRGVRSDAEGIDLDDLRRVVDAAREARPGGPASRMRAFLYTIATFNNPTGSSLPSERRRALVEYAAAQDLVILEDDTYRELAYDGPAPASLWALAQRGAVVRLGSFAKSVAPGLRCGYLTADAATAEEFALSGFLDSGGSPSQFTGLILAEYAAAGDYARGVDRFREAYRERRDALVGILLTELGETIRPASLQRPAGGYFVWLALPAGVRSADLEKPAADAGTGFVSARVFYADPDRAPEAIRLSFARFPPDQLEEAARRLARVIRSAAA